MNARTFLCLSMVVAALGGGRLMAQMPNPYGAPIALEEAKKPAAAALTEAAKNKWTMVVAIVDPSGNLIYYEKMDNTQLASAHVAIDKARTAAIYKRPTKAFQDVLAAGGVGLRVLKLRGATAVEGKNRALLAVQRTINAPPSPTAHQPSRVFGQPKARRFAGRLEDDALSFSPGSVFILC